MIKKLDLWKFVVVALASAVAGYFWIGERFADYQSLITFLAILTGFEMTSLAVLFNSPLKGEMWNQEDKVYGTELHKLKNFYQFSMLFKAGSVIAFLLIPETACFEVFGYVFEVKKLLVYPVLGGMFFLFIQNYNQLLKIFTHPTNH